MANDERLEQWTLATLKAHLQQQIVSLDRRLDERFIANDRALSIALSSAKEAVDRAQATQESRNAQQNEWRASLNDLSQTRMSRDEAMSRFQRSEETLGILAGRLDRIEGAAGGISSLNGIIMSIMAVLIAAAGLVIAWTKH